MIRILVVDDHTLVRDGLCRLLEQEPDFEVVGEANCGRLGVERCRALRPDVVVLDYSLPDFDGLETTRQMLALGIPVRILILTMHANPEYATRVIQAGASGFVVKAASTDELVAAVRKVAGGTVHVTQSIMEQMVGNLGRRQTDTPESVLSNRELQVLVRLARGATTVEISQALNLSVSTVETYRSRIFEKLGLRNVSDITRFAIRRHLIETD